MQCTAEEIAEKRRLAQQKLAQKRLTLENASATCSDRNITSNSYVNKPSSPLVSRNNLQSPKQFTFKPYTKQKLTPPAKNETKTDVITGTCYLISDFRFAVDLSAFSAAAVDIFKTIPTRSYSKCT